MNAIIILYNLQNGITPAHFENWVRTHDYPAMRALRSVQNFTTYRTQKRLIGDEAPSYAYIEVFALSDFEEFVDHDMLGETVQQIMEQFMGFAEQPEFIIARAVT